MLGFTGEDVEASRLCREWAEGDGGDRVDSNVSVSDVSSDSDSDSRQVRQNLIYWLIDCFKSSKPQ